LGLPIVAIRSNGLAFDAPIGIFDSKSQMIKSLLETRSLMLLLKLANSRFQENFRRMEALETNFKAFVTSNSQVSETKEARAARKRADGLKRQQLQSSMVLNNQNIDVDAFDVLDSISSI